MDLPVATTLLLDALNKAAEEANRVGDALESVNWHTEAAYYFGIAESITETIQTIESGNEPHPGDV